MKTLHHRAADRNQVRARGRRRARLAVALLASCIALGSCAYYNTYYYAQKYYYQGTEGQPYLVEKAQTTHPQEFNKAIEYSKKLIAQYPTDKRVDDAYLLWARSLLGNNDPRLTIKMLEEFPTLYPKSSLNPEAEFYLGVAYRQSRKPKDALKAFDQFLADAPKHDLAVYAHLERSRVLMSLERPEEAAAAASVVIDKYSKSRLALPAKIARAEARYAQRAFDLAGRDYHELGMRSRDDEERLTYLLRESDCLEAAQRYDDELSQLRDALSHEQPPITADSTGQRSFAVSMTPSNQRYGRLLTRMGTGLLASGQPEEALQAYRAVVRDFSHTDIAAEAQYRIGYVYETALDDFGRARTEYNRVKDQSGGSAFVTQAADRLTSLDRLTQFRSAAGDSNTKKAEAGFLLAEQYLFQLDKPERAIEEYEKVSKEFEGVAIGAKAINARAWVLSRRLKRDAEADSLFWIVIHDYPATEAQLAARDYLEFAGRMVPDSLIKFPEVPLAVADTTPLTSPPLEQPPLGTPSVEPSVGISDSSAQGNPYAAPAAHGQVPRFAGPMPNPAGATGPNGAPPGTAPAILLPPAVAAHGDSTRSGAPPDSTGGSSSGGARDTTSTPSPAPPDTTKGPR
jgi:TolA-binding protein